MAAPIAPALPAIPSRSAPEADFDVKMFALFKWATDDFVSFMEAWRSYLETSSTIVGGALNGTTIGQTTPAAGAFTELLANSLGGDAVQSDPLDVTPGKIPLVGGFGWGEIAAPVPNDNIDNIVASGNYLINAQVIAASTDIPPCSSGSCLLHLQYNSSNAAQLFFSHGNNLSYHRIKDAGVWSDWKALNAASGNNANGEWVRLPNGTQICTNQAFQTSDTADTTWTYPASFLYPASPGRPAVSGAISSVLGQASFLSIGGIAGSGSVATQVDVRGIDVNGNRVALAASLIAIGRWF
ncbi:pyocin knob domain-containing protein [Phaeobacter sp. G2]|nr:pyocin knob domain-containing protein [Phaeobacter sp. G2]